MNVVTRIAAPFAIAFFAIGAQAQEVAPGDLGIQGTSAGSRGATVSVAPSGDRSGAVASGDLNLQPVGANPGVVSDQSYSRHLDGATIVGA
jgi:hypothetical protein